MRIIQENTFRGLYIAVVGLQKNEKYGTATKKKKEDQTELIIEGLPSRLGNPFGLSTFFNQKNIVLYFIF